MNKKTIVTIALLIIGAFACIGAASAEQELTVQWDTTGWKKGPKVDWSKVEYGLRSDGVIVWRNKAKQ